jgi:hypothetical protein
MIVWRWWHDPAALPDGWWWQRQAIQSTCTGAVVDSHGVDHGLHHQVRHADRWRHQANVFRLRALFEHGGLWVDHDVVPLVDLASLRDGPWTAGLAGMREGCVMWFPEPGHPWLGALLERVLHAPSSDVRSVDVSGAGLLNAVPADGVGVEERVLPFDAAGRRRPGVVRPVAVHVWATSQTRHFGEV